MTDILRQQLLTLARYNVWATRRLYDQVDALPEQDYRRDAGLFFRSVHGTLNHLFVGEHLLWWRRFSEGVSPQGVALDDQPHKDRVALREALQGGAARWLAWIEALPGARIEGTLDYTTTKGVPMSLPFAATLAHVFNHGTHHRGQITAALTAMGHECPALDLVWMLQQEGAAASAPNQEQT